MGCNCGGGGTVSSTPHSSFVFSAKSEMGFNGPCDYTDEMLSDFKSKLVWFKDKGLYIQQGIAGKVINKYLGIVITSLNIQNKCTYKKDLDAISDLVSLIVTLQNG